jgi:phage-related baseplate assembly protein
MTAQALPVYFRLMDLSGVPVPNFVEELSYEEIRQDLINDLLELDPDYTAILESDPGIKVIEACAYREFLLRQRINDAARANTITEAVDADLDVLGALFNVERLAGEADDRFRSRVQQGLALLAAAGPREAYRAHAMSVSTAVVDASVHSPAAGEVVVTILAYQDLASDAASADEIRVGTALFLQPANVDTVRILARADSPVMQAVRQRLNSDLYQPLTDDVTIRPPNVLEFSLTAALVIYPGPDSVAVRTAALASLAAYFRSIRRVAYDATRSGLIAALKVPGVQNVVLTSPLADVVASYYDLAVCTALNVVVDRVDV